MLLKITFYHCFSLSWHQFQQKIAFVNRDEVFNHYRPWPFGTHLVGVKQCVGHMIFPEVSGQENELTTDFDIRGHDLKNNNI